MPSHAGSLSTSTCAHNNKVPLERAERYARQCAALCGELGDTPHEGLALHLIAMTLPEDGLVAANASIARLREADFAWGVIHGLVSLGVVQMHLGVLPEAASAFEGAIAMGEAIGERWSIVPALFFLGELALLREDYVEAYGIFQRGLAHMRGVGDLANVAFHLERLGLAALHLGQIEEATSYICESLRMRVDLGVLLPIASNLESLASVAQVTGQPATAARLLGAAASVRARSGNEVGQFSAARQARVLGSVQTSLGQSDFAHTWAEGQGLNLQQAIAYALKTFEPAPAEKGLR